MRKSRFTDSQIMDALRRVEAGIGVPDLCRDMGISMATFYKWSITMQCSSKPKAVMKQAPDEIRCAPLR